MKLKKLRPGDIVLVHTKKKWLPGQIRFWMNEWAAIHYETELEKTYNHAFIVVFNNGADRLTIAEADEEGFNPHLFHEHYNFEDYEFLVLRYKGEVNSEKMVEAIIDMYNEKLKYEFFNFVWWIPYILSNGRIDISFRNDRVFCMEAAGEAFNRAMRVWDDTQHLNSVDMYMREDFKHYELQE